MAVFTSWAAVLESSRRYHGVFVLVSRNVSTRSHGGAASREPSNAWIVAQPASIVTA
jgi:hypothetical protein